MNIFEILNQADSAPDFSGVISTISAWLNPVLNFVITVAALFSVFFLIRIGIKIKKAEDAEERRKQIHNLLWLFLGLAIVCAGYILVNVYVPAVSGGKINPNLSPAENS